MEKNKWNLSTLDQFPANTIGQDILRYIALPDLVGGDRDPLLYYIGKNIARHFDIQSMEDLAYFFHVMRWGQLDFVKEKRNEMIFHLMSDEVAQRIQLPIDVDFRLESGFLCEALFVLTGRHCECIEKINEKLLRAEFRVIFVD